MDMFLRDFGHEAGNPVCRCAAEDHALVGGGEIQLLLGAGEGDVAESALLLHLVRLPDGADAREDRLLHANDEHRRKLQPLGAVHGHEHHGVRVRVVVVHVRIEGDVGKIALQRFVPGFLHVGEDAGFKLPHVFGAGGVFGRVLFLEGADVAGLLQQLVQQLVRAVGGREVLEFQDQIGEEPQLDPGALELGDLLGFLQDLKHGDVLRRRKFPDRFHRPRADAAGRGVDDARQAQVVRQGGNHAQVGEDILDLGAVEEAGAADDAVRDTAALEGVFKLVGLGVHAVEHRMVAPVGPAPVGGHDLGGDEPGLVPLVVGKVVEQQVSPVLVCPELLALALAVVGDDGVGRVQNVGGTAVVLLKPDHPAVFVLILKAEDVFDRRAAEFIDALVVVADHADVAPAPREQRRELVLQAVGVLILVDQHVAEAALPVLQHVGVFLQELDGVADEIVKVHGVGSKAAFCVLGIDLAQLFPPQVGRGARLLKILRRGQPQILGPAHLGQDGLRREALFVKLHILDDVFEQAQAVGGVIDRKAVRVAQALGVPSEDAHTGRVEGTGPDIVRVLAQHGLQPRLELPGGLVGKGNGEDAPWLHRIPGGEASGLFPALPQNCKLRLVRVGGDLVAVPRAAVFEQVCDSVNEHRGLAAARAREDQQRPLRRQHGLKLHGV